MYNNKEFNLTKRSALLPRSPGFRPRRAHVWLVDKAWQS